MHDFCNSLEIEGRVKGNGVMPLMGPINNFIHFPH